MSVTCGTCSHSMDLHGMFGSCPPSEDTTARFPWQPFQPNTSLVLEAVAYSYHSTVDEITGRSQSHLVLRPRTAAAWLMRDLLGMSYPAIGQALGNRDHTTIMNLVDRAERLSSEDRTFQRELDTMVLGLREIMPLDDTATPTGSL